MIYCPNCESGKGVNRLFYEGIGDVVYCNKCAWKIRKIDLSSALIGFLFVLLMVLTIIYLPTLI